MSKMKLLTPFVWVALAVAATPILAADSPAAGSGGKTAEPAAAARAPAQQELERKFAEELTGSTLVGNYTVDGRTGAPSQDRYKIAKVTKIEGDLWRFDAQIIYGKHDVTVPLPLTVKWAGDTPVITLTDMLVPGLGTYTARVLFYRGRYAGTWSGSDHGGEMWGRIEKEEAGDTTSDADKKSDDAEKKADKKDS